jgi:MipA family protein
MIPFSLVSLSALALLLAGAVTGASAADRGGGDYAPPLTPAERVNMVFELGLGVRLSPKYPGAEEYKVSPFPIGSLDYLHLPRLLEMGEPYGRRGGLRIGPSFDYVAKRKSGDHPELTGLDDVDATYEAGLKLTYEWANSEVYGALRYAFGGADGLVGEFGVNGILRPIPTLELKAGPRATFASNGYIDAYFGVSAAESLASGGRLLAYDPDGGFKRLGVATAARYEFRPDWFLIAEANYDRLIGDASNSPVVAIGSADQFSVGLGLSRRFTIGF